MPRDTKVIRQIKFDALNQAISELKEASTSSKNLLTYSNVVERANEICSERIVSKISPTSIKNPSSPDFKRIKEEIEKFRYEYKKIKKFSNKNSNNEIFKLKNQVKNLIEDVAKFYDEKLLLEEELASKEKTIIKLRQDRDHLNDIMNKRV